MIIIKILGLILLWFALGFVINLICYSGKSADYIAKQQSQEAKSLHIILNILTVIGLIMLLTGC